MMTGDDRSRVRWPVITGNLDSIGWEVVGLSYLPRSMTMPAESKTDRLQRELERRIASGEYPPGSKLPSGAELREEFDVSQQVVRTAIDRLRMRGLVETVVGVGVYVAEPTGGPPSDGG
jgi:GntR family transcriptional regulator